MHKEAEKLFLSQIKHDAVKPESIKVDDIEYVVDTDSLVIFRCVVRGESGYGVASRQDMEFTYFICPTGLKDGFYINLMEKESIIKIFDGMIREHKDVYKFDPDDEDKTSYYKGLKKHAMMWHALREAFGVK